MKSHRSDKIASSISDGTHFLVELISSLSSPVSLPLSKLPVDSFTILGTGEGTSTGLGGSATATALSTEPAMSPPV